MPQEQQVIHAHEVRVLYAVCDAPALVRLPRVSPANSVPMGGRNWKLCYMVKMPDQFAQANRIVKEHRRFPHGMFQAFWNGDRNDATMRRCHCCIVPGMAHPVAKDPVRTKGKKVRDAPHLRRFWQLSLWGSLQRSELRHWKGEWAKKHSARCSRSLRTFNAAFRRSEKAYERATGLVEGHIISIEEAQLIDNMGKMHL